MRPDFRWGVATSAYQIEGAVNEGGRGESIWDRFARNHLEENADRTCEHYHRWAEDVDLMKSLGVKNYRFSIAWPRVMPNGGGPVNGRGLDFYKRLVERLHMRGIAPVPTLYHWDLPQVLEDAGGWRNRDTALRFADYANAVYRALGDSATMWITHNEPWCAAFLGHWTGQHAPGHKNFAMALRVCHNLLLSHGLAVDILRQHARTANQIGIALDLHPVYPADETDAARRMDGFSNRWILDALLRGEYPSDMIMHYGNMLDFVHDGDMARIATPMDFVGVNYYHRQVVREGGGPLRAEILEPSGDTTAMGWEITPHALYDLLTRLHRDYPERVWYVTENGAALDDDLTQSFVDDAARIDFLGGHIDAVRRAVQSGVDVRGYFVWSFMDNFEWAQGFSKRFGLVSVDFETLERTPKASAWWYSGVS